MLGFEHRKKSKGNSRVQQPQANKKTFYDRWGWLVLIASLTCVPFAFFGAGKAIQSNVNKVEDWLPKSFPETKELAWFRANFPSDQFILVSWEGCKLGEDPALGADGDDPRIAKLAELVAPKVVDPNDLDASEAKKFFKSVSTGRMLLDQLTQGAMDYPAAVERLKGSVLGPDGRQTCVIVSLDPETTSKLKPILGRGQMRIFRPNIPPGVLRRLIARAGIEEDKLHLGGPPVDNIAIDEEGEKTLIRLAGFSGLLGLGLAWWSLRSVVLTMIVFGCSVSSAAASLGMIWATGETVDAIVLSMPSLVYVLSISGAVHFINYYKDAVSEGGLAGATERAVIHSLKPAILCSTTTALGLLSLCASELTPIRKFGFYAAMGVMILLVVLYLLLPSALHIIGYARKWVVSPESAKQAELSRHSSAIAPSKAEILWGVIARFIVRNHIAVATCSVLVTAAIGFGLTRTRTSIDLLELFDSNARILRDYRWLEKNLGMLVPLEIVIQFDPESIAKTPETKAEEEPSDVNSSERSTVDDFLERMETTIQIQEAITNRFGEKGENIVGRSISAATFAPSLPAKGLSTSQYLQRMLYNKGLESKRDELIKSGFLRVDSSTGAELWRISLRVAAFEGVDYGQFVHELRDAVSPIVDAHIDRVRILKQISAWSGDNKFNGKNVLIWDPAPAPAAVNGIANYTSSRIHSVTKQRSDEISSLLTKSRLKVTRGSIDPASMPLVQIQKLNEYDAIVLTGAFSDGDIGTLGVTLGKVIDLQANDPATPKYWVSSTYTGVVPIVYKAQRALLQSLVESTLWSFLTITPLMMFVTRSFRAGMVAMIPNVVPVVVIFGLMGWLNIAIDIGSMMTASIALGVAVDDTIHFLSWFREDLKKCGNRQQAIVLCYSRCATPTLQAACISGIGLSVFAFSTFTPTQRFGWLMLTILVAGVVAELVLLPAILAGPLGRTFDLKPSRHNAASRLMLIVKYELRRRFDRPSKPAMGTDGKLQNAA